MTKIAVNKATITKITVFVILPLVLVFVAFIIYRQYLFGNNFINKTLLKKDMEFKFFTYDEFDSRLGKLDTNKTTYLRSGGNFITDSGKEHFNKDTILMLDKARDIIEQEVNRVEGKRNIYFVINSAYRTDSRNSDEGGVKNSAHRDKGSGAKAVDIAWRKYTKDEKAVILDALKRVGFNRFGIANGFIHVDNDLTLPNPANWTY